MKWHGKKNFYVSVCKPYSTTKILVNINNCPKQMGYVYKFFGIKGNIIVSPTSPPHTIKQPPPSPKAILLLIVKMFASPYIITYIAILYSLIPHQSYNMGVQQEDW